MQKIFRVTVKEKSYPVHIGTGNLLELGQLIRHEVPQAWKSCVLADQTVDRLYGDQVVATLEAVGLQPTKVVIPDGESSKSFETANRLYSSLNQHGMDRDSVVVGLGGGMIGDLAGFVAASYMRGLPFVQVPTTLLSQADSSLGGKVAVNHPAGKNMIGFFYHPNMIFIDTNLLKSLPVREVNAGMAEIIRHGMILDAPFFHWIEKNVDAIRSGVEEVMVELISHSLQIKQSVIETDEREEGFRSILNFGHTIGHALETLTGYERYRHGEAVAIGMVQICRWAEWFRSFAHDDGERLIQLLQQFDLPIDIPTDLHPHRILQVMQRDKKSYHGKIKLIIPVTIGQVRMIQDWQENDLIAVLNSYRI